MSTIVDVMDFKRRKDVNGLIEALAQPGDTSVRAEAALSLGQLADLQAVEPLIARLQSESDPYVRTQIVAALGNLGDPRAEPALMRCMESDTLEVGMAASESLMKL